MISEYGVKGFKFHPSTQAFFPNDRLAYPLYEVIAEAKLPALFHTGQTGVGAGTPGGSGIRLKYSNPMLLDDVAADFPDIPINIAQLPIVHHHVAAMPDVHLGIGATVGSVIPTLHAIIPAAVGVDIGCGMMATRLSLTGNDLDERSLKKVFDQISRDVPVGFGQ